MKRQEAQNFDLLEKFRITARNGKEIVEKAISEAKSTDVTISGTYVKSTELKKLKKTLEKVEKAQDLEEIRGLLNEETIPVELVIIDQYWGNFQVLIYELSEEKDTER